MSQTDPYASYALGPGMPVRRMAAVVAGTAPDELPTCLYVGVAGDVVLELLDMDNATATNKTLTLAQGWHPVRARKVVASGTTATGLFWGWP